MTARAYLRVSTDEQAESGLGLEAQEAACWGWVARNGGTITFYRDEGVSGSTAPSSREGLTSLLGDLAKGDVLLVAKRDRLARDIYWAICLDRAAAARGARIVSVAGEGTDDDSPTNVLMRRIIDAFGEYERLLIGARTKAALKAKKARGERISGRAPLGWMFLDGKVVQDAPERLLAEHFLSLAEQGVSTASTAQNYDRSESSVRRLLAARAKGWPR